MVILFVAVGASFGGSAPSPEAAIGAKLDRVVAAGVQGAVVFVRDGGRTMVLARGKAIAGGNYRMRSDARFRVGTITRTFVATVVLQLVAEKKLALNESVDLAAPKLLPQRYKAVTVRELLQDTSGLWDYLQAPPWNRPYQSKSFMRTWTPRQLVEIATAHKPYAAPGAALSLSSTPFIVLGLLIERVTHKSLAAELERRLIVPLRLHSTVFAVGRGVPPGLTHGYTRGLVDVTAVNSSWAWANGSLVSTATDVATFYRALLQGRLLPAALLKQMETIVWGNRLIGWGYGLGLERTSTLTIAKHLPLLCKPAWGHEGDALGYSSFAYATKNGQRQVVILLNEDLGALTPDWQAPSAIFDVVNSALCP